MSQLATEESEFNYVLSFRFYFVPLGVIFAGFALYLFFVNGMGQTRIIGCLLMVTTACALSYQCFEQFVRAPKTVKLDGDKLIAKMFFGKEVILYIPSIRALSYSVRRSILSAFPISIHSKLSERLVIGLDLKNLYKLIEEIKRVNPNCEIHGNILGHALARSRKRHTTHNTANNDAGRNRAKE